jgi:hypothetical protein
MTAFTVNFKFQKNDAICQFSQIILFVKTLLYIVIGIIIGNIIGIK